MKKLFALLQLCMAACLFSNAQNNALQFPGGSSCFASLANPVTLGNSFTIELWVYSVETADGQYHGIIGSELASTNQRQPCLYVYDGTKIHGGFGDGGSWNSFTTGSVITPNSWHHLALTYDGNNLIFYVDARIVSNISVPGETPYSGNSIDHLGQLDNNFHGMIDEVRIWDVARTQSEIKQNLFSSPSSSNPGLLRYYKFNNYTTGDQALADETGDGLLFLGSDITVEASDPVFVSSPIQYAANGLAVHGTTGNNYGNLPANIVSSVTNFTFEAWVYPQTADASDQRIFEIGNSSDYMSLSLGTLDIGMGGYLPQFIINTESTGYGTVTSENYINLNDGWHHIAVSLDADADMVYLYVDGQLQRSESMSFDPSYLYNPSYNYLGYSNASPGSGYIGYVDDVRFWNTARSATEIQDNMNKELTGTEAGLYTYYTFNQGIPLGDNTGLTTVPDMAGDNNLSLGSTGLTTTNYNYVSSPSQLSALPLTLLSFSAYQKNNHVELKWKTAAEENTALFEVERSSDGQTYSRIGTVAAAGNSSTTQSYQFTDQQVSNPVSYYRLKMVDRDAEFSYSKTIAVRTAANDQKLKLFPNPVNQTLYIRLSAGNNRVSILDASGKLLNAFNLIQQGDGFSSIDVSRLASGSYYIKAGNRLELFFKQ